MLEKNNTTKNLSLNKKLLSADEIAFNVRENLRSLIDTRKISFKNLTIGTGANELAIKNILNGSYVNMDSYLVYRIAHYFGYELDVFIQSNTNQLAMLKPTISAYQAPLDAKQFHENYLNKISSLIDQKKISQTEIKHYSSLKKERPKLTIYELHRAEYILDTKITNLFSSQLSKTPNLKTLNKFHLEAICDKVLTLIKQHNINIHELALAINEPPLSTINFLTGARNSGTNNTKLLFKIANFLEIDFNALLSAYENEFIQIPNISDKIKKFEKISKNLSIAEIDVVENYRSNLSYHIKKHGIQKSHLAKILGHPIKLIESGTNPIIVQDVANFFGFDPHTWLSYKSYQLPHPNPVLTEKILKKAAKILAIGGVLSVASVAPAMAFDYAVDEAYHSLSNYVNDAIIPNLAPDHPLNLRIKLGILTALIALEHVIVAEKLVEAIIRATLKDAINNVTDDKPLVEKLLSPPINLINIFNDVTEDYLENFKPIERDSKAWFETFNMIVTQLAKMIYERFDSLKAENKDEFDEVLLEPKNVTSTPVSHITNMEDVKNYFSRIFGFEMADHNLEKTDDVTSDNDNSELEKIPENIMNDNQMDIPHCTFDSETADYSLEKTDEATNTDDNSKLEEILENMMNDNQRDSPHRTFDSETQDYSLEKTDEATNTDDNSKLEEILENMMNDNQRDIPHCTFDSEMSDHGLEKTDEMTNTNDNSQLDEILEDIMNNNQRDIPYGLPKKLPGALEKIHHFAKKVVSDKSDDYLEKIICSGVSTTSYYLTQGVLNYAIAVTTLEFAFLAILIAQPGIDKAAEIIGDFAEKKCHDTVAYLKEAADSLDTSLQAENVEELPKLHSNPFKNEVHLTSTNQVKDIFVPQKTPSQSKTDLDQLTSSLKFSTNSHPLQMHQSAEISNAISTVNQINFNKNYQPEFKSLQASVGFFHKTNSANVSSKISAATASTSNPSKWNEISIITRHLPPPPGIPDSDSLIKTSNNASFQVEIVSGAYECLRVNNQSSIRFFDKGVLKTATAPSGYSIHGLYCRAEGSSDHFKLMKSGPKK